MFFHVIVLTILLTAIFSALGRVLIERCGLRGEEPLFYLMLSPAIGAAFWLGTTLSELPERVPSVSGVGTDEEIVKDPAVQMMLNRSVCA